MKREEMVIILRQLEARRANIKRWINENENILMNLEAAKMDVERGISAMKEMIEVELGADVVDEEEYKPEDEGNGDEKKKKKKKGGKDGKK
jgi:hypothetical protein